MTIKIEGVIANKIGFASHQNAVPVLRELNRPGFSRHLASSLRNAFQTLPVTADC